MRCNWRKRAATLWSARWVITRAAGMELLQDSEPGAAVAAPQLLAAVTARLQLEHLRPVHLRLAHVRAEHPQDEARHLAQSPREALRLPIPTSYMQPVKRT